jgi:hypothetical protein
MIDGWNKGSGDGLAAPYMDDSDYIGFDAEGATKSLHFIRCFLTNLSKEAV